MTPTKKWALGAVAVWLTLAVATGIYYHWDEELKPEVKQALAWQMPEGAFEDNGYLIALGLSAPASVDATEAGAAVLRRELSRWAEMHAKHRTPPLTPKTPAQLDTNADGANMSCAYDKERSCVDFYLRQKREMLDRWVASRKTLISRFQRIGQASRYIEVVPPLTDFEVAPFKMLSEASEILRMQAVLFVAEGQFDKGLSLLADNAERSRRLLQASSQIVSHMVALAQVHRDVRILSELLQRYPTLARQSSPLANAMLKPISGESFRPTNALMHERAWRLHLLDSYRHHDAKTLLGPETPTPMVWFTAATYLPNATLNNSYALSTAALKLALTEAPRLDGLKAELRTQYDDIAPIDHTVLTRRNAVGRILNRVSGVDFSQYVERQTDVNAFIGMVALQRDKARNPSRAPTEPRVPDPYTEEPMSYDERTGLLSFEGRQSNNGNFERSKRYEVPLR